MRRVRVKGRVKVKGRGTVLVTSFGPTSTIDRNFVNA